MEPYIKQRIRLAAIVAGALILIGIVVTIFNTAHYQKLVLHTTPYQPSNFTTLIGNETYSYNGAAFFRVSMKDAAAIKVLSSSMHLPDIKRLYWAGDKGALMMFGNESYVGTDVEAPLKANNISPTEATGDYVWYLDFASNKLSLVSKDALGSGPAYYGSVSDGFYYVARVDDFAGQEEAATTYPYRFYSISQNNVSKLMADVGTDEVTFVGPCQTSKVCVIQGGDTHSLWTAENDTKQTVYDFKNTNTIIPTGQENLFIALKNDPIVSGEESEDELLEATPTFVNTSTQDTLAITQKTSAAPSLVASSFGADSTQRYVIDTAVKNNKSISTYIASGKTLLGSTRSAPFELKNTEGDGYKGHLATPASYGENGSALFADFEDEVNLITPEGTSYSSGKLDLETMKRNIKTCLDAYTANTTYTSELRELRVTIKDDGNFTARIRDFSNCVAKESPAAFIGYNFTFIGVDPVSGRYTN